MLKVVEIHKMDIEIPQVGTELFLNTNDMIERLYSLIGIRAVENTSEEIRHETLSLLDSL